MLLDQFPTEIKAQARAANAVQTCILCAGKASKNLRLLCLGNADSLVLNAQLEVCVLWAWCEVKSNHPSFRAIFDRVVQQVGEHLLHPRGVDRCLEMFDCWLER